MVSGVTAGFHSPWQTHLAIARHSWEVGGDS